MNYVLSGFTPVELAQARRAYFDEGVRFLCTKHEGSVTSWGRTPKHNAELPGSVSNSKHLTWQAADVVWDDPASVNLAVLQGEAAQWGIQVVRESDHDHLQTAPLSFP